MALAVAEGEAADDAAAEEAAADGALEAAAALDAAVALDDVDVADDEQALSARRVTIPMAVTAVAVRTPALIGSTSFTVVEPGQRR